MERGNRSRNSTSHLRLRLAAPGLAVGALAFSVLAGAAGAASTHASNVVATAKNAKFGTILVTGKTVYTLKPSKVACTAQCLKIWPEVLLPKGTTKVKAGPGVSSARLGTLKRKGGALQVTYAGKALYWFIGDTRPGQVHGNLTDKWGRWSVVVTAKPAASPASTAPTPPTTAGTSPSTSPTNNGSPPATSSTSPPTTPPPTTTPPATSPPPTTTPPTTPPPPTTTPTAPPTTTTTAPGGGGVGF